MQTGIVEMPSWAGRNSVSRKLWFFSTKPEVGKILCYYHDAPVYNHFKRLYLDFKIMHPKYQKEMKIWEVSIIAMKDSHIEKLLAEASIYITNNKIILFLKSITWWSKPTIICIQHNLSYTGQPWNHDCLKQNIGYDEMPDLTIIVCEALDGDVHGASNNECHQGSINISITRWISFVNSDATTMACVWIWKSWQLAGPYMRSCNCCWQTKVCCWHS